jgi:hypothetical protein
MRVIEMPCDSDYARLHGILRAFPEIRDGVVLDVGCRDASVEKLLVGRNLRYLGFDREGKPDVLGDLGQGLPLRNRSLDFVLALDVLEHVDDIHAAFGELCRVSRRHVVITLPNMYEIRLRWRFARGLPLSRKYGLPERAPGDRHRWIFSLSDARRFCRWQASESDFAVIAECCLVGPRRRHVLGARAVSGWPDLLAPTYAALAQRIGPSSGMSGSA